MRWAVRRKSDRACLSVANQAECYTYDHRGRLTNAKTSSSSCPGGTWNVGLEPYETTYSYNDIGNITSMVATTLSGTTSKTYSYSGGTTRPHAVTSAGSDTYGYNGNGEMTSRTVSGVASTLAFDALHQLTSVTTGANVTQNIYDAGGQRLLRKDPGGVVTLYLDGQELQVNAGNLTATRYYAHGGGGVAIRRVTSSTNDLYWTGGNHQGTIQASVNASTGVVSRQRYTPFGAARDLSNQLPSDIGFLGRTEDDSTDLVYLGARYYDASLGQFISCDPIRYSSPGISHPYSYGVNSPITFEDPSGLTPEPSDHGWQDEGLSNCHAYRSTGYWCYWESGGLAFHLQWSSCQDWGDYGLQCHLANGIYEFFFSLGELPVDVKLRQQHYCEPECVVVVEVSDDGVYWLEQLWRNGKAQALFRLCATMEGVVECHGWLTWEELHEKMSDASDFQETLRRAEALFQELIALGVMSKDAARAAAKELGLKKVGKQRFGHQSDDYYQDKRGQFYQRDHTGHGGKIWKVWNKDGSESHSIRFNKDTGLYETWRF